MKNNCKIIPLLFLLLPLSIFAQLPQTKIYSGIIRTFEPSMNLVPAKGKYTKLTDSLEKNLTKNPKDTTSLFYLALIYYSYNQLLAEPQQHAKGSLEKLTKAKDMIESAIKLEKTDLNTKILRAQIYYELCYRFSADELWMFSKTELARRKKLFDSYKASTNTYYDELAYEDKKNAYDYSRKKITYNYPKI
ncbi:hypothetical protein [Pedobacter sp. MW01-1-1]|uniref:hypothetical protein n=1 Tax=Pedobacter sp. MW01-1-1 TaxID=3383027 RepID=UPI003FEF60C9